MKHFCLWKAPSQQRGAHVSICSLQRELRATRTQMREQFIQMGVRWLSHISSARCDYPPCIHHFKVIPITSSTLLHQRVISTSKISPICLLNCQWTGPSSLAWITTITYLSLLSSLQTWLFINLKQHWFKNCHWLWSVHKTQFRLLNVAYVTFHNLAATYFPRFISRIIRQATPNLLDSLNVSCSFNYL